MEDQQVREDRPVLLRDNLHEVLLDLHGVGVLRESQAVAQARDGSRLLVRVADGEFSARVEGKPQQDAS